MSVSRLISRTLQARKRVKRRHPLYGFDVLVAPEHADEPLFVVPWERAPERKPRRTSQEKLIDTAERKGLVVTGLNNDGSISTAPEAPPQAADIDEWDEWEKNRHAH
jgi:hypothetical protein